MDNLKIENVNAALIKFTFGNPSNPVNVVKVFEEKGEKLFSVKEMENEQIVVFADDKKVLTVKEYHVSEKTCVKFHTPWAHFLGLGEKIGTIDRRGRKFEMLTTDNPLHLPDTDPLYISIPFLIVVRTGQPAVGIFVNSTAKTTFDLQGDDYTICADDSGMEVYLIHGQNVINVVEKFTHLSGKPQLPPAWALGYQQSRWSYASEGEVMEIAQHMRKKEIPCDAIYLDIDYMDKYKVFTWSKAFPNPQKMITKLNEMGFKIVTIIDPGVKKEEEYSVYDSGKEKNVFVKKANGEDFEGYVWPGKCVFPDFLRDDVKKWWTEQHKSLFQAGVDGIWNDMNEPAVVWDDEKGEELLKLAKSEFDFSVLGRLKALPYQRSYEEEIIHTDDFGKKWKHVKIRNVYATLEAMATKDAFEKFKNGKRPFILSRAGFAGIQKYAAVWTGDNSSWWEHLEESIAEIVSLNLSGVSFCGADIGGFGANCTGELLIRWTEMGVFMPLFRNHSAIGTRRQEPWAFDKQTEEIVRRHIRRRYELFPHLYNLFYESSTYGRPIVRPILTCDQDDEALYCVNDEFMFGKNVLIAPVVRPNARWRAVYLPKGKWFSFDGKKMYDGKKVHKVEAPLDEIPVFVRENSMIFRTDPMNFLFEKEKMKLYVDVYGKSAQNTFYEDDGETLKYKEGEYNLYEISIARAQDIYHVNFKRLHSAYKGKYESVVFRIMTHEGRTDKVILNGKEVKHTFESGILKFEVDFNDVI